MFHQMAPRSDLARTIGAFAIALLLPVLLSLTVFPTPGYDTRELIAWGRQFPLITPIHPPLMTWVGGLTDLTLGSSAAAMIFVGQGLLIVGLIYFYRILRLFASTNTAVMFTFLYGTSFYYTVAPLSFALNADILQLTSWPAIIFHVLRALQTNRIRHWLAFGVWSAVAVLTKYNAAGLFVGLAGGLLLTPVYRKAFFCRGALIAILVGGILLLPHALAILEHRGPVMYGLNRFHSESGFSRRLSSMLELFQGYLIFSMPGSLVIAIGIWKKYFSFHQPQNDAFPVASFLKWTAIASQIFLVILILVGGLSYIARFTPPYLMLSFLALFSSLQFTETGKLWLQNKIVPAAGWLYLTAAIVVTVLFSVFVTNSMLQEPTANAARAVLEDWDKTYSCGPKYFIGGRPEVSGIGIEARRSIVALDYTALTGAPWFDKTQMQNKGAIIVDAADTPESIFKIRMAAFLPGAVASAERRITLPLRRTTTGKTMTFSYHFVAPADCKR